MRREWLMVLLVVVLLVPVGCGTTARADDRVITAQSAETYTVQSGDTLRGISRKLFGDSQYWDEIAALNGIQAPYTIYPGQELKLPNTENILSPLLLLPPTATPGPAWYEQSHGPWLYNQGGDETSAVSVQHETSTVQVQSSTPSKMYKVRQGDCLMGIARNLLGDPHRWHEIANLNGIGPPYTIYPGQELQLP